jgi:diguanylate cyclase (GGDEF)-like protein
MSAPIGLRDQLLRVNRVAMWPAVVVIFVVTVGGSFSIGLFELMNTTQVQARVLADNASAAMAFRDEKAAGEVLETLHHSPQIENAWLFLSNGEVFGSYRRDSAAMRNAPMPEREDGVQLHALYLTQSQTVSAPGERVGTFQMRVGLAGLYRQTALVGATAFGALLLATALYARLLRRLIVAALNPIQALTDVVDEVHSKSNLAARASGSHIFEIDRLSKGFNAMIERIDERDRRLARLAYFDKLTGLPNRTAFLERIAREVSLCDRSGRRLALLFMDLDGFKQINDTLGHDNGDEVLAMIAERLRRELRPSDTAAPAAPFELDDSMARLGGDEFTVLVSQIESVQNALEIAERLRASIAQPFVLEGRELAISCSIGVAVYPDHASDAANLLKHADTAMYQAKRSGRDTTHLYTATLTEQAMQRLEMDTSLRGALARSEFSLVYQPQIEVATGRVRSVEALIRWNHPDKGMIAPVNFIPLAEENGMIAAIGRWVLDAACADLVHWRAQGLDLRVAVNLSPRQIQDKRLVEDVREALARAGLPADRLELEITEGAVVDDFSHAIATLTQLRSSGIRIALDDFGTGQSSLSYLMKLPVDVIKVDRSFISRLQEDRLSRSIVEAIMVFARALGAGVVAEGVETYQQLSILQHLGCPLIQGYYYSKPVAPELIPELAACAWSAPLHSSKAAHRLVTQLAQGA